MLAVRKRRWKPMQGRQRDKLDAPDEEKWVAADEEGIGTLVSQAFEGRLDFAASPSPGELDLQHHGMRDRFHAFHRVLSI